jgi:hypothetical protein
LSSAAAAVLAQCRHRRTLAYFLSAANFVVATLPPPLTSLPPPTSNVAAAVYVDAISSTTNKNSEGQTPFAREPPPRKVVNAKTLTHPPLPPPLNSGESNIV